MPDTPDSSALYAAISAYASLGAVACALVVVWLQNRSAKRLLGFQLFAQMATQYESQEMLQARSRLSDALLADEATPQIDETLLVHYENVALLERKGLIDRQLIWNIYSHDVPRYWLAVRSYVQASRETYLAPWLFEEFEDLTKRFRLLKQSPLGTPLRHHDISLSDLRDFLRGESNRAVKH